MSNIEQHQSHYNSVQFVVICQTNYGQELRICGNSLQLGNWNPQKGHKLITEDSTYPQWRSYIPLIIRNSLSLQFKACIVSGSKVIWEKDIPNRKISPQSPTILQFIFGQEKMGIMQKQITQIDCIEGTNAIIREMDSSQTSSSIEFKANYPLQYFFQYENERVSQRKFSDSQLSSNLFSQTGQITQNVKCNEKKLMKRSLFIESNTPNTCEQSIDIINEHQHSQKQFQTLNIRYSGPQLFKTHSIKPRQLIRRSGQERNILRVDDLVNNRNRSKSRSLKKKDSLDFDQNKIQSPVRVKVPDQKYTKIQKKRKVKTMKVFSQIPDGKIESVSTEQQSEQNRSNSTVIEYDSDDEYFENRDQDVAIQTSETQFAQV